VLRRIEQEQVPCALWPGGECLDDTAEIDGHPRWKDRESRVREDSAGDAVVRGQPANLAVWIAQPVEGHCDLRRASSGSGSRRRRRVGSSIASSHCAKDPSQ